MTDETMNWAEAMAELFRAVADGEDAQIEADRAINELVTIDLKAAKFVTADEELNDISITTVDFGASLGALIADLEALAQRQRTCFLK